VILVGGKVKAGTSWRYHGAISSSVGPAWVSRVEHNKMEPVTVQKVTFISCWVNDVFMEVYLVIAWSLSLWRLSYPE
jgi:hypothetical protein